MANKVPRATAAATGKLVNGGTYTFNARVNRQRPALLCANGFVYVAFGSHCELDPDISRGWVLAWKGENLLPLSRAELTNRLAPGPDRLLTAIWMSGAGPAALIATPGAPSQSIYSVTDNSDKAG